MLPCMNVLNTVNIEQAEASVHVDFEMFAHECKRELASIQVNIWLLFKKGSENDHL